MSFNYKANQFDQQFLPTSLCNWEVPRANNSSCSRQKTKVTRIIANDRGHLLPGIAKSNKSTAFTYWDLPNKILTKQQAFELNGLALQTPFKGPRWVKRSTTAKSHKERNKSERDKALKLLTKANSIDSDLSYVPGQIVEPTIKQKSPLELDKLRLTEELLGDDDARGNKLYLEDHNCEGENYKVNDQDTQKTQENDTKMMNNYPAEEGLPCIPAYYNFETARMMAQENLRHQPLHVVDDANFRSMQATGDPYPGLALDVMPRTTGVGVRNFQAGPTQCTKLRVYRPKTCGIVPKPVDKSYMDRPHSSIPEKKMGPMDLAICWDYRPRDEPRQPAHIDGSNESAGPAIFSVVRTPRAPDTAAVTGRSTGALFANTFGEENFFDKDLVKRNGEYNEKYAIRDNCDCGNQQLGTAPRHSASSSGKKTASSVTSSSHTQRPKTTATRPASNEHISRPVNWAKSSPDLTQLNADLHDCHLVCLSHKHHQMDTSKPMQRYKSQPDVHFQQKRRIPRECHKNSQMTMCRSASLSRPELRPFKAGIPKNSFDSGCGSSSELNLSKPHQMRVVKPPRDPYAHRNYNINTLAPPFACWKGGSGQGGYPEHWRLASVYQHAYKPIDLRKRPLLQTVYQ